PDSPAEQVAASAPVADSPAHPPDHGGTVAQPELEHCSAAEPAAPDAQPGAGQPERAATAALAILPAGSQAEREHCSAAASVSVAEAEVGPEAAPEVETAFDGPPGPARSPVLPAAVACSAAEQAGAGSEVYRPCL